MKTTDNIELTVRRIFGLIRGGKRNSREIKFDMAVFHTFFKCHVYHECEGAIAPLGIGCYIPVVTPDFAEIAEQCKVYDAIFPEEDTFSAVLDSVRFIEGLSIHYENDEFAGETLAVGVVECQPDCHISVGFNQSFDELALDEIKSVSVEKLIPLDIVRVDLMPQLYLMEEHN